MIKPEKVSWGISSNRKVENPGNPICNWCLKGGGGLVGLSPINHSVFTYSGELVSEAN